jgi:hypothetical protein
LAKEKHVCSNCGQVDMVVTPSDILFPEDFEQEYGVHVSDDDTNRYVQEAVKSFCEAIARGEDFDRHYTATGDVHIMVFQMDGDVHVHVYRNPQTCVIYESELEKGNIND